MICIFAAEKIYAKLLANEPKLFWMLQWIESSSKEGKYTITRVKMPIMQSKSPSEKSELDAVMQWTKSSRVVEIKVGFKKNRQRKQIKILTPI